MERRRWILPTVLALALAVTGAWGYSQYRQSNNYEVMLNNQYQRMFFDMKDHVETTQVSLSKALLSESKENNILLLSQIWQQALYAQDKLSQLPVNHGELRKTEKFLSQVGDYSYALIQSHLDGKDLTSKQRHSLTQLQDYTTQLSQELSQFGDTLAKGNLTTMLKQQKEDLKENNEDMISTRLVNFEENMTEYPELIYDGPFSDQVLSIKPKGLGTGKVTEEEAKKIAGDFIGDEKARKFTMFEQGEQSNAANIDSYTFSMAPENEEKENAIYIGISKTGGKVVWMENPRPVSKVNISVKQAEKHALEFLDEKGYKNMEINYSLKYDGAVLFNLAYKDGDVTVYPDLIKVKVALDNGEILAFDAAGYLKTHHDRNIPEPKLSQDEARSKVRLDYDIENVRLTVIPKNGKTEILCYEFKGKYRGEDYIVYINAETGKEEQILRVIRDENGTLMI